MLRIGQRRAPHGHHRVADELIDHAVMAQHLLGDCAREAAANFKNVVSRLADPIEGSSGPSVAEPRSGCDP